MQAMLVLATALMLGGGPAWKTFAPQAAGFEVLLPGNPTEKRQTVRTIQGNGELRLFTLGGKAGSYAVGVTELPDAAVTPGKEEQRLDLARDGAVQQATGRLRWEKKILVAGCHGRDLAIGNDAGATVRIRLIADHNRLYQLLVVGDAAFLDSPDAARFLDSFKHRR